VLKIKNEKGKVNWHSASLVAFVTLLSQTRPEFGLGHSQGPHSQTLDYTH